MLPVVPLWFHIILICALFILALVKGDRDTLIGTLYVCASATLSVLVLPWRADPHIPWIYVDLAWAAVDFAALFTLAMVSRRGWTLAAGSIALVSLVTAATAVVYPWPAWVRGTAEVIWYFMLCAVLIAGCLRSKPRKRRDVAAAHQKPVSTSRPCGARAPTA